MTSFLARSSRSTGAQSVRRAVLATAVVMTAVAASAAPALAQQRGGDINYGYEAPPGQRFNPDFQSRAGVLPPVDAQERIAARIEQRRFEGPRGLLRAAGDAVRNGQWGRANELLERAETRTLNTAVGRGLVDPDLGPAGTGPGGAVVSRIGDARDAVVRGNPQEALRSIGMAMARIDDAEMFEARARFARERFERDRFAREQFERGYRAGRAEMDSMNRSQGWRDSRGGMDRFDSARDPWNTSPNPNR